MPRPDESSPNFDFLDDNSAVRGDSATNLIDPPADESVLDSNVGSDAFDFDDESDDEVAAADTPTSEPKEDEPPASKPEAAASPKADKKRKTSGRKRAASPFDDSEIDVADADESGQADDQDSAPPPEARSRRKASSEPSETVDLGDIRGQLAESDEEDGATSPSAASTDDVPKRRKNKRRGGASSRSKSTQEPSEEVTTKRRSSSKSERSSSRSKRSTEEPAEPTGSRSSSRRASSKRPSKSGFDWDGIKEAGGQTLLIAIGTYAGLVTLALAWLVMNQTEDSRLENLPDVKPIDRGTIQYIAPTAAVPEGHTIPLGGGEQFGYIKIEPLRITQGSVTFVHESDADRETSFGLGDTPLQLHVRLTNMSPADSNGQNIAPLDRHLLYYRMSTGDFGENIKSNQYVYSPSSPAKPAAMLIELAPEGEWKLKGQELPTLAPGESVETFIAANAPEKLDGKLVWRVQLRKGFHLPSGHGVTTLVDVPFDADAIKS